MKWVEKRNIWKMRGRWQDGCIILIITIIFVQLELGSIASTGENRYCHLFVIAIQIHHIIQIHGQYLSW